jgi:hypothetical protein
MSSALARIDQVAARQLALVTRQQLRDAGITDREVGTLVERRLLRRIRRSVYAIVGTADTWERALLAAVLAAGNGALASHSSAARLWVFAHRPEERLEIMTARDHRPHLRGVIVHSSAHLDEVDIAHRDSVPCTAFERTLCDCTASLSSFQLGRVLDDGLRRRVASLRRLHDCAERLESAFGRRMSVVRSLLAERGIGFDPGGSGSELRLLRVLRDAEVPLPAQQYRLRVRGRTYVLDFAWPDREVFAEYYGLVVHSGASAVAYDSQRITDLAVATGWTPLIFTDATPDSEIVAVVKAALAGPGVVPLVHRLGA